MQKKKFIITLLFAVLSIFMITACSDNSNESNSGGGGTIQPEPNNPTVKKFYKFGLNHVDLDSPYLYNYALLSDGSLYAWGDNNYGQLGLGDDADEYYYFHGNQKINIPDKINELIALEDKKTAIFKFSLYAITEDGELYVWGSNSDGRLGIGNTDNQTKPVKVTGITGKIKQLLTFMDVLHRSIYAITEDGSLYAWGTNDNGQLGVGDEVNKNRPTKVNLHGKLKELITTDGSTYAILEDGSLYAWGRNGYGVLGVGEKGDKNTPTKVNLPGKIKELITTRSNSAYAILEDGSLFAWGRNGYGVLGVGDEENKNTPTKVNLHGKLKELITTGGSTYAILEDGSLYAWGRNGYGVLGVGDEVNKNTPTKVNLPGKLKELITTGDSTYAILEDGSLYAWGYNYYGQLGVGDEVNKNTPTKVNLHGKLKELITIGYSTYAILEDGSLYAWDSYDSGQLGVGDEVNKNRPTKVNLPGKLKELITTWNSTYAILEDGSLYAWGYNDNGQLGVGDENNKNTPAKVNLPDTIKEIITEDDSVYAILEDGSLYAWGNNSSGQLGIGRDDYSIYTPEQVIGIDGTIKYISLHVFLKMEEMAVNFLTEDGLLYGTGYRYSNYPEKIDFYEK